MRLLRRILVELRHLAAKVCVVVALATVFVGYATPMISPAATEQLPPRTKLTVLVGAAPGGGRDIPTRAQTADRIEHAVRIDRQPALLDVVCPY